MRETPHKAKLMMEPRRSRLVPISREERRIGLLIRTMSTSDFLTHERSSLSQNNGWSKYSILKEDNKPI